MTARPTFAAQNNLKIRMELKDIVSISGKPGLNQIIGKRPNGLIVETIDDQKKRFSTSLNQKVSILEDISIYTTEGDVRLAEVFVNLHKQVADGLSLVTKKDDNKAIRAFFTKVLPTFDVDRVYTSDIVKVATWYELLKSHIDFSKLPEEASTEDGESTDDKAVKTKTAKPKAAKTKITGAKKAHSKAPKLTQRKMS
ncbi:MAG: hypothetical protein ACI8ZN_001785 [Bacteroidia bacterium]|jgi:hypothetical protein